MLCKILCPSDIKNIAEYQTHLCHGLVSPLSFPGSTCHLLQSVGIVMNTRCQAEVGGGFSKYPLGRAAFIAWWLGRPKRENKMEQAFFCVGRSWVSIHTWYPTAIWLHFRFELVESWINISSLVCPQGPSRIRSRWVFLSWSFDPKEFVLRQYQPGRPMSNASVECDRCQIFSEVK